MSKKLSIKLELPPISMAAIHALPYNYLKQRQEEERKRIELGRRYNVAREEFGLRVDNDHELELAYMGATQEEIDSKIPLWQFREIQAKRLREGLVDINWITNVS